MKCKSSSDGEGWILEDSGGDDGYFEIGQETCGSVLAREGGGSDAKMLDDTPHSRAGSLPQWFGGEFAIPTAEKNPTKFSESVTLLASFDGVYSSAVALFGDSGLAT